MKHRIRKNSITEDVYLARNGTWGKWRDAAKFNSVKAAETFAKSKNIEVFGLFTQKSCIAK
jgi:hypothetical protein